MSAVRDASELDGIGAADLAIRYEIRQEGKRPSTKAERKAWAELQAQQQAQCSKPQRRSLFEKLFCQSAPDGDNQ